MGAPSIDKNGQPENEQVRFRGAVVRSRYYNTLPWGSMRLDPEVCQLVSGTGLRFEIARQDTAVVRYETVHGLFVWRTTITFLDARGRQLGRSFVATRPPRVLAALEALNWPVEKTRAGFWGREKQ